MNNLEAITYPYFPTKWQAVIWRNWGYIPAERIAMILKTDEETIRAESARLGLNPNTEINPEWNKRGYLTTIRENWHLCTNEQIMELLQLTEEEFLFTLKEDDFMWVKLGNFKPEVSAPRYMPLTEEQGIQTEKIVELMKKHLLTNLKDNAFEFVNKYQTATDSLDIQVDSSNNPDIQADSSDIFSSQTNSLDNLGIQTSSSDNLRMVYPYFALYGDALLDESIDPLPEKILEEYARTGINGIWLQMVLYQLVEFPFEPSISKGWEKRIASLNRLVAKAKKYGIGIYPYFNEPRAMREEFFEKYPHLKGEKEDDYYAMCTSTKEVQDYLYGGIRKLFEMVPDLAGFFAITMSENLTNCYSRLSGEMTCPRCKERKPWEVIAEVNNLMAKGAHDANPNAKTIIWAWGWDDEWAEKVIPLLTENQIIQCTSEEAMEFCIGGVDGRVLDYTMSLCGPGKKAQKMWNTARQHGFQMSAKVQINNTWEMSVIPFIPVFSKVEQHINQLKEQGIQHLHAGWTLGGCPSPNLRLAAWLMEGKGDTLEFLKSWLDENVAEGVYKAQKKLSDAFSHYPFHINTLYYGPQNFGHMAPFFIENTGYEASMIGFPYDDVSKWSGIYPVDIYEKEYLQLLEGWRDGVECLQIYEGVNPELNEIILMAKTALYQYESAYHHIRFVNIRNASYESGKELPGQDLIEIIREEMKTVKSIIELRLQDSRIGYESSNHYFYTIQDLKEKIINLAYCEELLDKQK